MNDKNYTWQMFLYSLKLLKTLLVRHLFIFLTGIGTWRAVRLQVTKHLQTNYDNAQKRLEFSTQQFLQQVLFF